MFHYPADIRKAIDTTHAIESFNRVIRKVSKKRKLFPSDDAVKKVIFLAIEEVSRKWTMSIQNWRTAMSRFMIQFEDQLKEFV